MKVWISDNKRRKRLLNQKLRDNKNEKKCNNHHLQNQKRETNSLSSAKLIRTKKRKNSFERGVPKPIENTNPKKPKKQ